MTAHADPARPAVLIPRRFEPLMSLVRRSGAGGSRQKTVFPSAFDLLCFAAAIGYGRNKPGKIAKTSSDKTTGGEVVMNVPDRADRILCDMIAVVHTGDHDILKDGKLQDRLDIFMKYACGGLDYLMELTKVRQARAAVELVIRGADQDDSVDGLTALIDGDNEGDNGDEGDDDDNKGDNEGD